jgi:hypothetical protein
MITLHLRSQILKRAELKLLHCAFATAKLLRDFPNAALLDETLKDHSPLVGWQIVHQSKQPHAIFNRFHIRQRAGLW